MEKNHCCGWLFYRWTHLLGCWFQPLLLLVLRLYWGAAFVFAGAGKLMAIGKTAEFFANLGIPWPEFSAYLVGGVELVGGFLLIIGLCSRFAALFLSAVMVTALLTAHWEATSAFFANPELFFAQEPVSFLVVTLVVFAFGPGALSVDRLIGKGVCKRNPTSGE